MLHKLGIILLAFSCLASLPSPSSSGQASRTHFINHESKVSHLAEPQWFLDNIPFLEVPVKEIEEVYYYRWSSLKRHLRYTIPGAGYIITEFIHKAGWSVKFDTISAAAGHHINEAKWLRNRQYVQDYINFWTREGGSPQQYSEWIADTAYKTFLVHGDAEFIKSQQLGLVRNYKGWDDHFDAVWNLYWISPEWDAMEFSCSSVQTEDGYHGGAGFRPSLNSEMYGNALAIAKIASLNNDTDTAREFENRAASLREAILQKLWDPQRKFFYHAFRDENPNFSLLDSREEIGFYPWQYNIPPLSDTNFATAWEQLFDPQGFYTEYGPTTCEVRSQWFDGNQTSQCCWWNGNSWPYSTSLTLHALAAQVRDYANLAVVGVGEYVSMLTKYAATQYKNGQPYVAECHSPSGDFWVCDGHNNSEHYAHSTYTDNVLSGLIGIEPQASDVFQMSPLIPGNWRFFAAENIPYHGHEITVLYDADGTYYETGHVGLQIFVNGVFAKAQSHIGPMSVPIPPPSLPPAPASPTEILDRNRKENYASNPNSEGYPEPSVSFNSGFSSPYHPVDGRIIYDYNPSNRWTNFASRNPTDWFAVNFGHGRSKTIDQVKIYVYSDVVTGEGGVDCPKNMSVEIFNGATWIPATNQKSTPSQCSPNNMNTIDFDPVSTEQVRVLFTRDVENDYYVGMTEIEIWAKWPQAPVNTYEAEDGLIIEAAIFASSNASGGSFVREIDQENSSVEITGVWVDKAGNYTVNIFYANGLHVNGTQSLLINAAQEEDEILVNYLPTGGWENFGFISILAPLQRGSNVLIFRPKENNVALDKIQIIV